MKIIKAIIALNILLITCNSYGSGEKQYFCANTEQAFINMIEGEIKKHEDNGLAPPHQLLWARKYLSETDPHINIYYNHTGSHFSFSGGRYEEIVNSCVDEALTQYCGPNGYALSGNDFVCH